MSLSGALTAAVTGIDAQSSALGSISNNIANSQTVGYKAVGTDFSTLLTVSNAQVNEPGGVTSTPLYGNDIQGTVQQTGITTNLAVSGSGMFAVSQALGANNSNALPTFAPDPLYTRAGDFSLNSQGFLVNTAGYYLNGFAINQTTGAVEKNALIPIQLNELESNPLATSNITYSANLPTSPPTNLNTGSTTSIPVVAQTVTYPAATANPFVDGESLAVVNNAVPPTTTNFTFSDTSLGAGATTATPPALQLNFDSTTTEATQLSTIASELTAQGVPSSIDANGNLVIGNATGLAATPTTSVTAVTFAQGTAATVPIAPTTAATAAIPANIQFAPTTVSIFDAQGAAHSINVNWTKVSGTNDTYTVTYTSTDPAITGITPATPTTVQFNVVNNKATGATAGSVLAINGVQGAVGTAAAVPLAVSFGGNTPTVQDVTFGLGSYGVAQQTTMFTGTDVNFISAQQDGLPPGSFTGLDINQQGNITLNFNNGATKSEFQVPLAQFANFDGLQPQSGNAYSTTVASGTPSVNSPGDNGTGAVVSSAVEGSNVDIAAEFTSLIQTQRAYEANTKVVTTVNELLQETDQLIT
jgi:flagellar hook protein FlgE